MTGDEPAAETPDEQLRRCALAWAAAWDGIGDWKTATDAELNKLRLRAAELDLSAAARRVHATTVLR